MCGVEFTWGGVVTFVAGAAVWELFRVVVIFFEPDGDMTLLGGIKDPFTILASNPEESSIEAEIEEIKTTSS